MNLKQKALFRYKVGFIRDGKRYLTEWKNNLILDSGLDKVASFPWADCFKVCYFGNQISPTPVQRNSGATTLSQALTTITASANFFEPADTGRLFKFDSGEEAYLTYVSATVATASISRTVGSGPGTVWYVNQTAIESNYQTCSTYGSTGGDNGTSFSVDTITMKRTFVGVPIGSPVTLTEIGFGNAGNTNIFDRDIIVGGVSLVTGDIPLAISELLLTITQTTPGAVANVATGYDSSGTSQVVGLSVTSGFPNIATVATNGTTDSSTGQLEPYFVGTAKTVLSAIAAIPAFSSGAVADVAGTTDPTTSTKQAYSNGNFYCDSISTYDISTGNGTVYGFAISGGSCAFLQKFTTPFTKGGTQTLSLTIRKSWQRILTN